MKFYHSILFKIWFYLLTILTFILILYGSFGYFYLNEILEKNLQLKTNSLIDKLLNSLEEPLWNLDVNSINAILSAEVKNNNEIDSIILYQRNDVNGLKINNNPNVLFKCIKNSSTNKNNKIFTINIIKNIGFYDKIIAGNLYLEINKNYINESLELYLYFVVLLIFILDITIFIIVYYLVKNMVFEPLNKIQQIFGKVNKGDLTG